MSLSVALQNIEQQITVTAVLDLMIRSQFDLDLDLNST